MHAAADSKEAAPAVRMFLKGQECGGGEHEDEWTTPPEGYGYCPN